MKNKMLQLVVGVLVVAFSGTSSLMAKPFYGHHHHSHGHPGIKQAIKQIKSDIEDLDSRVTDLESSPTPPPPGQDFSGYGMPFAPDGEPKNVIVLTETLFDGSTVYRLRVRYASSTETLSINGVPTQRPYYAGYGYVQTDPLGNVVYASNYIEAPDTEDYINFKIEISDYDLDTEEFFVVDDTLQEDWTCAGSQISICTVRVSFSATDEYESSYRWSSVRALGGPLTVNGMTFPDVRFEEMVTRDFSRIRAKGIGEIFRLTDNGERKAIYYRVNGATGGSLAGTPFESGGDLDGVFF